MIIEQIKEYNTLEYYSQFSNEIPVSGGIYYWVYWPFKDSDILDPNYNDFENRMKVYSAVNFHLPESVKTGYKFHVAVQELWLDHKESFGLSISKYNSLRTYLKDSKDNRIFFLDYLKKIAFSRPFYIGKANCLQNRLKQHFDGRNSQIISNLEKFSILACDVLIGFEIINDQTNNDVNAVLEEIAQRIIKPALTKRPG